VSDIDKTKEAILEIFKRDCTTAPEALFMMSVLSARMIVATCSSPRQTQIGVEKYFNDVVEAISATQAACGCPECRKHLN